MHESEGGVVRRTGERPVTVAALVRDLRTVGVQEGMTLLVHSSLSRLGWVAGGAQAVVLALEAALGETGTLMMPTHSTSLTEPSTWQNPPVPESWWPVIREETPAFDPDLTPTRGMGAIVDCFRSQPGVIRSAHPHFSFAARGPQAAALTAEHRLTHALGEGSPLARLYERDGWVLLLGVGHANNTSLHLAEYRADYPGKRWTRQGAPVWVNGARQWVEFDDLEGTADDFAALGAAFEATGQVRVGRVGHGEVRLMRQRAAVDFARKWIEQHRR